VLFRSWYSVVEELIDDVVNLGICTVECVSTKSFPSLEYHEILNYLGNIQWKDENERIVFTEGYESQIWAPLPSQSCVDIC